MDSALVEAENLAVFITYTTKLLNDGLDKTGNDDDSPVECESVNEGNEEFYQEEVFGYVKVAGWSRWYEELP